MRRLIAAALVVVAAALAPVASAEAQRHGITLIRDAEIENIIRDYATPIFDAAGLSAESVHIHLVDDPRLNAFVAGGQRLFLHTGLLRRAETPEQVIGVIAHEVGHISGGHLARLQEELRNAEIKSIIAAVLGGAAGLATGEAGAATAIMRGGSAAATTDLLRYSRTQESAADAAGMKYLDRAGISSRGMLEFFEILQRDIRTSGGREHPYMSTHPLTNDRISAVESHLALSRYADAPTPERLAHAHAIMRAKLIGFQLPLGEVLRSYPADDDSVYARYARAIAYYRQPDLGKALPLIDGLIEDQPDNPYFYELKGQMLLENGRVAEALPPYEKMVERAPNEPLLRVALARTQLELNDASLLGPARDNLLAATGQDRGMADAWRLLTVAYGRLGEPGQLALAQAEFSLLTGDKAAARSLAERATNTLPTGSPGWLLAQDIVSEATRRLDR